MAGAESTKQERAWTASAGKPRGRWAGVFNWGTAGLVARLVVGGLFIYMGLNKALHPVDFLKLVRQYDMVSQPLLLNLIAAGLPWFEIFCGVLVLAGVAVRGTAVMLVAMLIPFSAIVLARALDIAEVQQIAFCAVKFDCGCGGGEVYICRKLVENFVLLGLSVWLVAGGGRLLAVRYSLGGAKAQV